MVGASVTYRPELEDLLIRWRMRSLPRTIEGRISGGRPSVVYGLKLRIGYGLFEVRASAATTATGPTTGEGAMLYRCEPVKLDASIWDCQQQMSLGGSFGTTGNEVRASVPLAALDAEEGETMTEVRAFTAIHESAVGGVTALYHTVLDRVSLPSELLPRSRVELGVVRGSDPPGRALQSRG